MDCTAQPTNPVHRKERDWPWNLKCNWNRDSHYACRRPTTTNGISNHSRYPDTPRNSRYNSCQFCKLIIEFVISLMSLQFYCFFFCFYYCFAFFVIVALAAFYLCFVAKAYMLITHDDMLFVSSDSFCSFQSIN